MRCWPQSCKGRANLRALWSRNSGMGWIQTRAQFSWTTSSSLLDAPVLRYIINAPTYETCLALSLSLRSQLAGGLSVGFPPLFSGDYLWELCWLSRRCESAAWRRWSLCHQQDKCGSWIKTWTLIVTDTVFIRCLAIVNVKPKKWIGFPNCPGPETILLEYETYISRFADFQEIS